MPNRYLVFLALGCAGAMLSGCPKANNGGQEAKLGDQAELLQDYDSALIHFDRALKQDPANTLYRLKAVRLRALDGQYHVQQGQEYRKKGDLQMALSEFQKAASIDPANELAIQEGRRTMEMMAEKSSASAAANAPPAAPESALLPGPPLLTPLSTAPIDFKATNDVKFVFQTIGKLAGITVIFDPTLPARRITVDLPNVTLEQALDVVALQSGTFWKPVTSNIVLVAEDNTQKRTAYEEEEVETFYVANSDTGEELNDIQTALRTLLNLRHMAMVKASNAIVIRATPDTMMLVRRLIESIDKAKPEVDIKIEILQANRDRARDLGISPTQSASITFTGPNSTTSSTSSTSTTSTTSTTATTTTPTTSSGSISLQQLKHLNASDFTVSLPSATVNALLTDADTRVLQDPEVRAVDGQRAQLKIGERVPIATGSFQAGVGVGATSSSALVNPLVNTQFQYQDVGVNIDLTPRIDADDDISLKLRVEVSSIANYVSIGGINQPEIAQNVVDGDVRIKDGQMTVVSGIIQRTQTRNISGWPGFADIPLLRYLFSSDSIENIDQEVLMVLIPHIVRRPSITMADLASIASGAENNIQVRPAGPAAPPAAQTQSSPGGPQAAQPQAAVAAPQPQVPASSTGQPSLRFEPANITIKPGETAIIGIQVQNVNDLFSIPMLLQYNPAVISVEEVRHGGFLGDGMQDVPIVQRVDQAHGQAVISSSRMPNSAGVNGTGTLVGIVVKGLAPGDSKLSIVEVNARNSQQQPIQLVTNEGTIHVQQ
jgi:general secretion pathway protein D